MLTPLFFLLCDSGSALAASVDAVPFTAPSSPHLFERVGMVEAKGSEPGDACEAAVIAAMASLTSKAAKADLPTLVSVSVKHSGEPCVQKKTGETVLSSVVVLEGMAIAEEPSLPSLSVARVVTVAATLAAVSGGFEGLTLVAHDGAAWWAMPEGELAEGQPPQAQAASMLLDYVLPALTARGASLESLPEVAGLTQAFTAGKRKTAVGLRLFVPASLVAKYLRGNALDDDILQGARVETQEAGGAWTVVSEGSLELLDAGGSQVQLREVDMDDADLEGLEDKE